MSQSVQVRKLVIGKGEAKICVPVAGGTGDEILMQIKRALDLNPDIIEWRCDAYESLFSADIEERIIEIREIIGDIPLIFTFRTSAEGGEKFISNENYYDLNVTAARTGMADLIDVEAYSKRGMAAELISEIHSAGGKVIASFHDFSQTPAAEEMENILMSMEECGADVCKIAVMPKKKEDVNALIKACACVSEKMIAPVCAISMGELGAVTRVCARMSKSAVTFAKGPCESAPGQLDCRLVREVIRMAESVNREENIFLTGFMGTGKSTVSSALHKITGLEEVDTDRYIEQKQGMTVADIFKTRGEEAFRAMETEALREIQSVKGRIVSCGGGVVMRNENLKIMRDGGVIVLLKASPEVVFERVRRRNTRPLLNDDMSLKHVTELMDERKEKYEAAADFSVNTDHSNRVITCHDILAGLSKNNENRG